MAIYILHTASEAERVEYNGRSIINTALAWARDGHSCRTWPLQILSAQLTSPHNRAYVLKNV